MKFRYNDLPPKEDVTFPPDHEPSEPIEISNKGDDNPSHTIRIKRKEEMTREDEIADLDFQLSEIPNTRFNREKRKQIEAHRKELVKAQQAEERERLKLSKQTRKEEERQAKWRKKAVDAETATKIAEEHQREALARDRKRRAKRRKVDRIFDFIGKIIFTIILIVGVLCISNQTVRDRVAITFNNLFELIGNWVDGDGTSSNKTVDDLLKPLGEELNEINGYEKDSTEKGFDIEE